MELNFQPTRGITRAAGLLYLAIIVLGLTSELTIRGTLVTPSDVGRTIEAISAHETLYRLSFAADLLMTMADIALAAFLFFLLSIVNLPLAFMAALFRLVQAAIIAIGLLHQDAVLMMLGRDDVEHAIAMHIKLQAHGYDLALVFFGVNCLITGFLVARSGFLPPVLGVLIAAAGGVYLAGSGILLLAPAYSAGMQSAYVIPAIAETSFCLWLLVRGVDAQLWQATQRKTNAWSHF